MRARNIKPGFFTNDDLAACQPLARLVFAGLWCLADRLGRLADKPLRIKAQVLPYDNCDIDSLLAELARHGFILRYTASDGCKYIQVNGFLKHQNPHKNEPASTVPAPEDSRNAPESSGVSTEPIRLIPDSGFLIPDSSNTSCQGELGTTETASKPTASRPTAEGYPVAFEEFWSAYPNRGGRKRGKHKCLGLWKAISSDERQDLLDATRNYAASDEARRDFARDPERFLRANWWRDYLRPGEVVTSRVATAEQLANWNPVDGGLAS